MYRFIPILSASLFLVVTLSSAQAQQPPRLVTLSYSVQVELRGEYRERELDGNIRSSSSFDDWHSSMSDSIDLMNELSHGNFRRSGDSLITSSGDRPQDQIVFIIDESSNQIKSVKVWHWSTGPYSANGAITFHLMPSPPVDTFAFKRFQSISVDLTNVSGDYEYADQSANVFREWTYTGAHALSDPIFGMALAEALPQSSVQTTVAHTDVSLRASSQGGIPSLLFDALSEEQILTVYNMQ